MKKINIITFTVIFLIFNTHCIWSKIPDFRIGLIDTTYFTTKNIRKDTPVLFYYFSPSCGDCKIITSVIVEKMSKLKQIQIIMITNESLNAVKAYSKKYNLSAYSNLKIGTEGLSGSFLLNFSVTKLPLLVFYDVQSRNKEQYCFESKEIENYIKHIVVK